MMTSQDDAQDDAQDDVTTTVKEQTPVGSYSALKHTRQTPGGYPDPLRGGFKTVVLTWSAASLRNNVAIISGRQEHEVVVAARVCVCVCGGRQHLAIAK